MTWGMVPGGKSGTLKCADCGKSMKLRRAKKQRKGSSGLFYGCSGFPDCAATLPAHEDGTPDGEPVDEDTRMARRDALEAYNAMWRGVQGGSKASSRRMLADELGIPISEFEISKLDITDCLRVLEIVDHSFTDDGEEPFAKDVELPHYPTDYSREMDEPKTFSRFSDLVCPNGIAKASLARLGIDLDL